MVQSDWAPFAVRTVYEQWPTGGFRDTANRKAVWHKTGGYDTVLDWYPQSGGIPHFTILSTGKIHQHYPCNNYSRALRNLRGGVETNTDGAIQIEIVGFTGKDVDSRQLPAITKLAAWLTAEKHVAPLFPMGRLSKPYRRATNDEWDNGVGHFAHGQVPEQDHTDPDMTDLTWAALVKGVKGSTVVAPEEPVASDPVVPVVLERGRSYVVPGWPGWTFTSEKGVDVITVL